MNTVPLVETQTDNNMKLVHFDLVDSNTMSFKIMGVEDEKTREFIAPLLPHKQNEIVILVSGKYPLNDYRDTFYHTKCKYIFQKEDGSKFSGILHGFTHDCTFDGQSKGLGIARISVILD